MAIRLPEPAAGAYAYPLLLKQLLHTPLASAPHQQIVYRNRARYTYRQFAERLGRVANALTGVGVSTGSVVAVMEWDSHRYLECYFAIPMLGAVLQTVNVRLAPDQLRHVLEDTQAQLLLVNDDFLPLIAPLLPKLPRIEAIVRLTDDRADVSLPRVVRGEYEDLLEGASEEFDFPDFDERAIATTFHTSGTTGLPKAVSFSHRQLVLHTLSMLAALAISPHGQSFRQGDVYMPMTPMYHVHAWGLPYVATLLGVKQVYPGRYEPQELLALRLREGVSYSHCVPTILQMLLAAAESADIDLRGWKITVGGAALSPALATRALRLGVDVFAGYGMSETGPTLTLTRLPEALGALSQSAEIERRCSVGFPIPLVDRRIVDAQMRVLANDGRSHGEVVVRAPWATLGYGGDKQRSEELWMGGYLHTQDVAEIHPEGHLVITDRLKDMIKSGGEWISSLQIESLISRHRAVAEVAVIAIPDTRWGERPLALVVAKAEFADSLQPEEIMGYMAAQAAAGTIPRYSVPERVHLVAALERTSVGKVDKHLLRERYAMWT